MKLEICSRMSQCYACVYHVWHVCLNKSMEAFLQSLCIHSSNVIQERGLVLL